MSKIEREIEEVERFLGKEERGCGENGKDSN